MGRVIDEAEGRAGGDFLGAAEGGEENSVLGAVSFEAAGGFGGSGEGSREVFVVDGTGDEFFERAGGFPGIGFARRDVGGHLGNDGVVGLDEVAGREVGGGRWRFRGGLVGRRWLRQLVPPYGAQGGDGDLGGMFVDGLYLLGEVLAEE